MPFIDSTTGRQLAIRRRAVGNVLVLLAWPLFAACSGVGTEGVSFAQVDNSVAELTVDLAAMVPDIPAVQMPNAEAIRQAEAQAQATIGIATEAAPSCSSHLRADATGAGEFSVVAAGDDATTVFAEVGADHRVSHDADASGAGEFFAAADGEQTSVRVSPGGTSTFVRTTHHAIVSVVAHHGGAAELYHRSDELFFTVFARSDGSGEFYYEEEGRTTTAISDGLGSWEVSHVLPTGSLALVVKPDGSGVYREGGSHPRQLIFGPSEIQLHPPAFKIEGEFPYLEQLTFEGLCGDETHLLEERVLFDFGSSELREDANGLLATFVGSIADHSRVVQVAGHADAIGSEQSNLDLSLRRAETVATALRSNGLTNVTAVGLGESQPVAPNTSADGDDDADGRSRNRRVEITIKGNGS